MGNEFGHPEWIDFPRVDTYNTSTGAFIPGEGPEAGGQCVGSIKDKYLNVGELPSKKLA